MKWWDDLRAGLPGSTRRLKHIEARLDEILNRETQIMALGQEILDAITAQSTVIDSFIALVQGLVANNTIDTATAAAILGAIADEKAKVEAAIIANTPSQP